MSKLVLILFCIVLTWGELNAQNVTDSLDFDFVFPDLGNEPLEEDPEGRSAFGVTVRDKMFVVSAFTKVDWFQAQQICGFRGLSLASINSQQENDNLIQYLISNGLASSNEVFWLSGTILANDGRWSWFNTGRPVSYRNWGPGEPNNLGNNEKCLQMRSDGTWNDAPCETATYFICETRCPLTSYDLPIFK